MSQGLAADFSARGPWVTRFVIDGIAYGGEYDAAADDRLAQFRRQFPRPGRVLDLGCLEGGFTIELAKTAEEVIGIDARATNLARARWISETLGVRNVDFIEADLESFDFSGVGNFDVVFNVGLLYHLKEPWTLLERLAERTQAMFLWTHIAPNQAQLVQHGDYAGIEYAEFGRDDPLSGLLPTSFWPSLGELRRMLAANGFGRLDKMTVDHSHVHGPAVTMSMRTGQPTFRWPWRKTRRHGLTSKLKEATR